MTYRRPNVTAIRVKNATTRTILKLPKLAETSDSSAMLKRASRAKESSYPATVAKPTKAGAKQGKAKVPSRKTSRSLTATKVEMILQGAYHAIVIGLPLNRMITIDWEQALVDDCLAARAFFLRSLRDWLRSLGFATANVWVQECGDIIGTHTHMLVHVPPACVARLGQLQKGWLKRAGVVSKKGIIVSKPIGLTSWVAVSADPETHVAYLRNLKEVVHYIAKDASSLARRKFRITKPGQFGIVVGKRAGTSRNLGAKAMREKCG